MKGFTTPLITVSVVLLWIAFFFAYSDLRSVLATSVAIWWVSISIAVSVIAWSVTDHHNKNHCHCHKHDNDRGE